MKPSDADYPRPASEAVSKVMRGNRKTDSRPEAALRRELHRRGLRYRKNPAIRTGIGIVRPDLVFPSAKVAVFVDGCFWHSCPVHGNSPTTNRAYWEPKLQRNRERDARGTASLIADKWTVLRIWEHTPLIEAADAVESAVRRARIEHRGSP